MVMQVNDYFAVPRFSEPVSSDRQRLSEIISIYDQHGVKLIHIACPLSINEPLSVHMFRRDELAESFKSLPRHKVTIRPVSVVALTDEMLIYESLHSLAIQYGNEKYIYLYIPPSSDTDAIRSRLHTLVFKKKLIPVIIGAEKVTLTVPSAAEKSIFNVPRAIYQIDLYSLCAKRTRAVVSHLISSGKRVVFGTGDKFDLCLYSNSDYYTKLLSQTIGTDRLGYFMLRHNRVFR